MILNMNLKMNNMKTLVMILVVIFATTTAFGKKLKSEFYTKNPTELVGIWEGRSKSQVGLVPVMAINAKNEVRIYTLNKIYKTVAVEKEKKTGNFIFTMILLEGFGSNPEMINVKMILSEKSIEKDDIYYRVELVTEKNNIVFGIKGNIKNN